MWKSFVREYLRFSRKERYGILLLSAGMFLTCYAPDLFFYFQRISPSDSSDLKAAVKAFEADVATQGLLVAADKPVAERITAPVTAGTLFNFDPNTLSLAGWQRLGVSERTAGTIQKYLLKGGHFRDAADLKKIYGLPPALSDRLMPYVRIAVMVKPRDTSRHHSTGGQYPGSWGKGEGAALPRYSKKAPASPLDINVADTLAWQELPGIGPGFARRIVAFRERLGGFYEVQQVGECYGLEDSVFQKIQPFLKIGSGSLKKMDLNLTDEKSLAAHPYIRYKLARLIVAYRNAHAGFKAVEELRQLPLVDEIIYRKIEHYIQVTY
ncbi:ComEA family DNA-binding protein [Chitinophaga sp. 30R24]|uniref:ComEA family DNA-binding protein n=1 Tax=Chitinophaga sp. 30R24 TaxID=3248838 RepID=UPI003B90F59A